MKILQFCKKTPIPPKDGESIAIHQLSKAFEENNCDLTVFSLLTNKHKKKKSLLYLENVDYHFEKLDTDLSYAKILQNLFFSKKSYIVERFFDKKVNKKLIKLLQKNEFDVIQLEGVFLGDYIPTIRQYSNAKIVLRAHNVEHQIWERLSENYSFLKKMYLEKIMIPRLKKFETMIASKVDMMVCISNLDKKYFDDLNVNNNIITLPATYKIETNNIPIPENFHVGFIGGLDWQPNSEGVKWFLKNVWKQFVLKSPKSNFNLAGRNFPKKYYDLKDTNLFIFGEVGDAQQFTLENSVMIAPILSGSGMRIKIIEAMALGRTVISTSIGAEGIAYTDKKNIFIADTAKEWIEILNKLSSNKQLLIDTAIEGKKLIAKDHDIDILGKNLINTYKEKLLC